ncbi:uncharacterized protein LOC144452126 [Glandiceps talaboti]
MNSRCVTMVTYVISVFYLKVHFSGGTAVPPICEPLVGYLCEDDVTYNQTAYPNYVGHTNSDDANLELHQFSPLVQIQCSVYLVEFLCAVYHPPCDSLGKRPPCRSICQSSYNGCYSEMEQFGFQWPSELSCSLFPDSDDPEVCFGTVEVMTTVESPPSTGEDSTTSSVITEVQSVTAPSNETEQNVCEPLTSDLCQSRVPYNQAGYPNFIDGGQNSVVAEEQLQEISLLFLLDCSPNWPLFLCAVFHPQCIDNEVLKPCRSFCQDTYDKCGDVLRTYSFEWPAYLNCNNFPDSEDPDVCLGIHDAETTTPTSHVSLTFSTQSIAETTTSTPATTVQSGCPDPGIPAGGFTNIIIGGGTYRYPVPDGGMVAFGCDTGYSLIGSPVSTCQSDGTWSLPVPQCIVSSVQCEDITIPTCQSLPYTQTGFPNLFGHESQQEARDAVTQYEPFIGIPCHDDLNLILCAALIPRCEAGRLLPLCQSLCQEAELQCGPLLRQLGYSWPAELECSQFPDSNDSSVCVGSEIQLPAVTTTEKTTEEKSTTVQTTTSSDLEKETSVYPGDKQTTAEPRDEPTSDKGFIRCDAKHSTDYCHNGGTCFQLRIDGTNEMRCLCHSNFTGRTCEEKILTQAEKRKLEEEERKRNISIGVGVSIACIVMIAILVVLVIFCRKHAPRKARYFSSRPDVAVFTNPAYDDVAMTAKEGGSFRKINKDDDPVYQEAANTEGKPATQRISSEYDNVTTPEGPYQEEPNGVIVENKYAEPAAYCEPVEDVPASPTSDTSMDLGHADNLKRSSSVENSTHQELDGTQNKSDYATLDIKKAGSVQL